MSFWANKDHRTALDDAEDLSSAPSGGRVHAWLYGVGLALFPIGYGIHCLLTGHTRFFGRRSSHIDLHGSAAVALAIAYIAIGLFIHAHWFWGLHPRLERFSNVLKTFALVVFLGGFGFAVYQILQ